MRILILGAFNEGALEHYYIRGLRQAGAECSSFDITRDYYDAISHSFLNKALNKINPAFFFEKINKKLFQFLGNKQFDVILVFKGHTLYSSTIKSLKAHTKLLCCYNPDHPFRFFSPDSGNQHTLTSIGYYDIHFTYAENICLQLKQEYKKESYVIPFGYDDFDLANSSSAITDYDTKWLFIGAWDKERMAWLSKLSDEGLNIYGDSKWSTQSIKGDYIATAYQGRSLYDDEYKTAIQNASGIINLLRRQNIEEDSHNMRTFEVPGYGGLLIANRTKEQQLFFEEDKEAIYFSNVDELNDKLNFLKRNKHIVNGIKQAAKSRSEKSGYGYSCRSNQLYQILLKHL